MNEPEKPEEEKRMLLTDEEAKAEEKRLEQFVDGMAADSADLPPEF